MPLLRNVSWAFVCITTHECLLFYQKVIRATTKQHCPFESKNSFADIRRVIAALEVTLPAKDSCHKGLCLGFALRNHQCHAGNHLHRACEAQEDKTLVVWACLKPWVRVSIYKHCLVCLCFYTAWFIGGEKLCILTFLSSLINYCW